MATTGDFGKSATATIAAASSGANFANFYGNSLSKGLGGLADGTMESARIGLWGSDIKKIEQYKFDKEFMESPETMDALTKSLGSRELAQEAIKDGSVQALLNSNITDRTMVAKALKLKKAYKDGKYGKELQKLSDDQALARSITMAKSARDLNPAVFVTMSDEQNKFREEMRKQGYSKGLIDQILDEMDEYNT